ncbi:MAG TPA: MotA/TolQ/ExbB proton channel family protein [Stellaceae bacterium]|nr:MotA/TolQ/ExbB proton channel family protein [Stellaceae bacterium]
MTEPTASLSIVALFFDADIVVKGVLLLLLAASVWSWTVIIDKLWRIGVASRLARQYEARAASGCDGDELVPRNIAAVRQDPAALVLRAGAAESARPPQHDAESWGERRDRVERAMRLTLSTELRRLEARAPFLATLGSAAPFIGLFGTVWGIMHSFNAIAEANSTGLSVVAPGIAEALFATAMGLAAAIPAVIAYNKIIVELGRFSGRMQVLIGRSGSLFCQPSAAPTVARQEPSHGRIAAPA